YSFRDGEDDSLYHRVRRAFMGAAGRKLLTPRAENHVVWHSRSVPIRKTRADRSSVVARNVGLWPVRPADILSALLIRVPTQRSGTPLGAGAQTESMFLQSQSRPAHSTCNL